MPIAGVPMLNPMPDSFDYRPPLEPFLNVVYEDRDIVVFDKPSGLLSVAGNHPDLADCLETRARTRYPTAAIVHRLDKDTSGLLVMALSKRALAIVSQQFEKRETEKDYQARVFGILEGDDGQIDMPIGIDWENKPRHYVDYEYGRPAQTDWHVLEREEHATRVRLVPLTGRTHQLRVHMLAIGHPILGDEFYALGAALRAADRLQLHAEHLRFRHPTSGEVVAFTAPCPF
jgi:tRNA pseudouridine32 synthase / 23S rRNA pseudouridine746 synthase